MPSPISGIHAMLYSHDPAATRAFLRDVLGFPAVDAGHGWLIFGLPPAELGVHPVDDEDGDPESAEASPAAARAHQELFLMCADIHAAVADLTAKGVRFTRPIADRGWGILTSLECPGAGELHLYQPRHPTAIGMPGADQTGRGA